MSNSNLKTFDNFYADLAKFANFKFNENTFQKYFFNAFMI